MIFPKYNYLTDDEAELFKFTSEGPKGKIKKLVVYSRTVDKNIYNIAFGDYHEETETIQ